MNFESFSITYIVYGCIFAAFLTTCDPETSPNTNNGYVITDEGIELYYQVMGNEMDTLVVIHGGPGAGMHTVIPMMEPLSESFTLVFYDQRGGGRSTLPADTTQLQSHHFVEDMESVRKYFGLQQMNVITHSFGSILTAEYAKKYPDRLKRMVFHGSTGPDRSEAGKYYRAQAAASTESRDTVLSNRATELLQSLLNGTASNPVETCREYEEISRQLLIARGDSTKYEGTTCNAPPEAIAYYYQYSAQLAPRYFGAWNYLEDLKEVTAPLLVVYGERDTLGIPMQQQWVGAVPNARLQLVPNAGKSAFSDNPIEAFTVVEEFFKGRRDQPKLRE